MSIMKMKNIISQLLRGGLLCVAITAFVTSCSTDEITYATGQKPDKETLETVAGTLRSSKSLRDRVPIHLTEGNEDAVSDKIYYRLNQAASQALTLTATPNPSLVADYNADNKANLQPLPVANIKLANGGKITIPAGTRVSEKLDLTIESDGLTPGIYLMPVVVNISENEQHVLYYGVTVREFDENIYQEGNNLHNIELDTEWTTVFYLNTSEVQAHYADYVAWEKQDMDALQAVVLPGGMPGTLHLEQSPAVACALETARRQGAYVCAICAAPSILGHKGLLRGRKAVCFPGYEQELEGARVLTEPVVTDGTVITARGAGVAVDFGLEIAARLVSPERAEQIRKSMQCR